VDVGLDRRGVDPELAAPRHLQRPGELDHPVVQRPQRLGADGVGPADQDGVVGDLLEVDPAELAEHQAVVDEVLGLLVAPAVEPHDHEYAKDDLDRGGGTAAGPRARAAAGHIGADTVDDLIVVEQSVELLELGLETEPEAGDEREEIRPVVAVPEHARSLQIARKQGNFAPKIVLGKGDEARRLATEAAARMRPLPADERNPTAGGDHDDLILWLAYKEAKAMIGFDTPPAAPAKPVGK
jgi:hypothetical protein